MRLSNCQNSMAGHGCRSVTFSALERFAFLWRRIDPINFAGPILRHELQAVLIDVARVPDIAKQLILLPLAHFGIEPLLAFAAVLSHRP